MSGQERWQMALTLAAEKHNGQFRIGGILLILLQ